MRNKWLLIVGIVLLVIVKRLESLLIPQLYLEDHFVFFYQNYTLGLRAILEPYAGYYHTLPRLIALVGGQAPYEYVPLVNNILAIGITICLYYGSYCIVIFQRRYELPLRSPRYLYQTRMRCTIMQQTFSGGWLT